VAETINRGEAQAARLATTKATVPSVRAFATHMLQAHTDAEQSEMNTAKRLNMSPETSDLSDQLESTARNDIAELSSTPPDQFDRKYIDAMVRGHEQALDVIDHQLIPALLGNEELSADMRALRARVNEHLQEARRVQAELAQASSSGQ
jgi:putative membrane protein